MARLTRVVGALGAITRLFSLAFIVPVIIALAYDVRDVSIGNLALPSTALYFLISGAIAYTLGSALKIVTTGHGDDLRDRDAYLTVGLGWIWLCLLAMLPFLLTHEIRHPVDAFFETMSGITTTGATVMPGHLEDVAPSVLAWRALLQWIGGMGIIVLSVALIGRLTQGGLQMLQAEAPGPTVTKIVPRLASTARILWGIYLAMTAILFVLLVIILHAHDFTLKQLIFEAFVHALTTVSTGGFSSHDASIAYFNDWVLELVLIIFMLAAATNFSLHFQLIRGRRSEIFKDPEWRMFMTTVLLAILVLTTVVWRGGVDFVASLRGVSFTVTSLITSTGFGTMDYDAWPAEAVPIILLLMFTGATAGSTGGGIKHVRILVLMRLTKRELSRSLHPRAIVNVKLRHRVIPDKTILATVGFFAAFVAIWALGTITLIAGDSAFTHPAEAASASVSALSNIGPGLGIVGPTHTYADLNALSKLTLAMEMWFGRLEIFTALLVFTPKTWRN